MSSIFKSIELLCHRLEGAGISESDLTEQLRSIISSDPDAARLAIVNERDEVRNHTLSIISLLLGDLLNSFDCLLGVVVVK
jgi:molybdopterin-biosynthesis enzyme MoeA-like protein